MKKAAVPQRIKIALLLAMVFILVFAKNRMDTKNVSALGHSFTSVYEDRLVVEGYIFRISHLLYQKKIHADEITAGTYPLDKAGTQNREIETLLTSYAKTKLTPEEETHFKALTDNIHFALAAEKQLADRKDNSAGITSVFNKSLEQAEYQLHQLSGIQIKEGQLMNDHSKRVIAGSTLLTQFELGMLVILGLTIQVMIFTGKTAKQPFPENPQLN
ncbi:MCP four helix bundle domain-containing protein [Sediminibacterium ginsengisoli]|uniref:Four helix bundle sensory module for signal transduction n=1 Tax=Sediminibacterium ginsengisoli TaxID=413434 RepID=A0A1T4KZ12_9BACT|nr:MCP four helix bundle domain-containing protein [Sediminibacterium ginsengisoli]SJZ47613.1 Four helix bundle sensory module for signal transduction [Sediminibacterium ginsengisoli]